LRPHRRVIRFPDAELTLHNDAVKIFLDAEPVDLGVLKASFAVREQSELDAAPM
jgi:hypothetical protein